MTSRILVAAIAITTGVWLTVNHPFPEENALLQLVFLQKPWLFHALKNGYLVMGFTTPWIGLSTAAALVYIFLPKPATAIEPKLPPYPDPARRETLSMVLGEVHHAKKPMPVENPTWLTIPDRGLYTGTMIFGAIGSGKTSGCMHPFAEQILAFKADDPDRRAAGLVLEVKGDFCRKVKTILEKHNRGRDYLEISLDTPYRYNPLHNDLDAYASAYSIASLLNNLYGRGKEPFWQQAYTNLVKFIILLHKIRHGYVTLFDVYECAINPALLKTKIEEGEADGATKLVIEVDDFMRHSELEKFPFDLDSATKRMSVLESPELTGVLKRLRVPFAAERIAAQGRAWTADEREQFEAVKRWFNHDWMQIEPKLRTSIIEGISVFLSLFDDNPAIKRVFCPPKETYDPVANADHRFGIPMPPFAELIEKGTVCALNFPVAANPGLARALGTMMKQDFQRALLMRIPKMEQAPNRPWRDVLFLCDEYHAFATVGEHDPSGDEKFFALSRQAKCIPIVATQSISSIRSTCPGESWRTLLQTFRTKIFLSLSDDFSARTASELCGKEEQLKLNYSISEHGQDAVLAC